MDIGLRNYLLGFRDMDVGHVIEKIVIAAECVNPVTQDRIKIVKLVDFLLERV